MSRYFYYLVIITMLTNTVFFVPHILIERRFNGTMPAIYLSILSGSLCAFLFVKAMRRFPKLGLPEIFRQYLSPWFRIPYLLFLVMMWFTAGAIVLINYARLIQHFINPDIGILVLITFFILICSWVAAGSTQSVIYLTEIIVFLHLPLIGFILFKALSREYMDYDSVWVMFHYSLQPPSWVSLSTATYIFTGYVNLAVFNRLYGENEKIRFMWVIPIIGAGVLFTTYLIPVGYHGTYGVNDYVFLWQSTADSMRIQFGLVERALFIFMLLYFSVSLAFICVTWHVASELLKGVFMKMPAVEPDSVQMKGWSWCWFLALGALMLLISDRMDDKRFVEVSKMWFMIRYPSEMLLVALMVWLGIRKKKA